MRREEKFEIPFSNFEKRKRNLQKGSPFARKEREMDILFSYFERRKRILKINSPNVRAAFGGIAFYWMLQYPKFPERSLHPDI